MMSLFLAGLLNFEISRSQGMTVRRYLSLLHAPIYAARRTIVH